MKVEMTKVDLKGTYLQGYFPDKTKYADLVKVFGQPNGELKGIDVDAEWWGRIDGQVFAIYNYKTGRNFLGKRGLPVEKITEWHIGALSEAVANKVVKYFKEKIH